MLIVHDRRMRGCMPVWQFKAALTLLRHQHVAIRSIIESSVQPDDIRSIYNLAAEVCAFQQADSGDRGGQRSTVHHARLHRDFRFALPPLAEQKAIAAVLGALDDKIELNRRMNATLEAMARALFQSWFVDFDPVRAKLDGRQPPGLDPATAALFPNEFEDSELGHIPKGWEVVSLQSLASIRGGKQLPTEDCLPAR